MENKYIYTQFQIEQIVKYLSNLKIDGTKDNSISLAVIYQTLEAGELYKNDGGEE